MGAVVKSVEDEACRAPLAEPERRMKTSRSRAIVRLIPLLFRCVVCERDVCEIVSCLFPQKHQQSYTQSRHKHGASRVLFFFPAPTHPSRTKHISLDHVRLPYKREDFRDGPRRQRASRSPTARCPGRGQAHQGRRLDRCSPATTANPGDAQGRRIFPIEGPDEPRHRSLRQQVGWPPV